MEEPNKSTPAALDRFKEIVQRMLSVLVLTGEQNGALEVDLEIAIHMSKLLKTLSSYNYFKKFNMYGIKTFTSI